MIKKFASILDYPHPGLDPAVWGSDGKLLSEHRELIRNLLKSYLTNEGLTAPEQWVKMLKVVGSLTTYQYTFDTDFDIHIETDLPAFIRTNKPEMSEQQAHEYLDDFRKRINETIFLLPGTQHPLEIFFETPFVNPEGHTGSGMYDILTDKWVMPPVSVDKDFNIEDIKKAAIEAANEIAKELDVSFGEVKQDIRRIEDLEHVANAWTGEQKQFYENKIDERLQKLDSEIKSLIVTRDEIVLDRRKYDPQGDAEVKFKYLQRFGYLFILSSLKEFLKDDGKVTRDELPEIKEIIQEASLEEKKLMIDFDDTIAKNSEDHEIESPLKGVKEALDQLKADGWKLVIYSCRANDKDGADEIRSFMNEHELPFDEVFVGKPHAEYYIDDKNIVFTSWKDVLNQVGQNKKEASFTHGYCAEYAVALSEKLNKPLGVIRGYLKTDDDGVSFVDAHAFVFVSPTIGIDANGERPIKTILSEVVWTEQPENIKIEQVSPEELEASMGLDSDALNQARQEVIKPQNKEAKKKGNGYEYSAVLVNLPKDVCSEVIAWGKKNIPDEDIYEGEGEDADKYGREDKCHVTVLYGLHTNKIDDILEHVNGVGDISLKFGKIGYFSKEDKPYDVVMVEIDSKDLHKLNKVLSDNLEFTNEFPKYEPHMTIAYVKKGKAKQYEGKTLLDGDITVEEVIFSPAKGKKEEVSLDKEAAGTHAPESTELSLEDGFIDPDGKFYPTEVHSHTSWAHTFFDTEYPELLEKGWIRVSVLPDELYFELRGINAKQMSVAEDLFYLHQTNPVVWDLGSKNTFEMTETDLLETGMSFFEYTTKRLRKKAAFMPSITHAPDNKWGPDDQVIPVDPNAVDAEETWENGEHADKPRDRSWMTKIIDWFKEPKQEKDAAVPTEQQIDQNTRVVPRSDGAGVIVYVDDLEFVPDSLNGWLAKNVNHGDFVTVQDKHGNEITLRYPMRDIKRLIKFKLYQPEMAANLGLELSKTAYLGYAYWVDPNGKVYTVSGSPTRRTTHRDWIVKNQDMLGEKYGLYPEGYSDGMEMTDGNDEEAWKFMDQMFQQGWTRIGDSSSGQDWGVSANDIKKIPDVVEDVLMQFIPQDATVYIEDKDGGSTIAIKWPPEHSLQQAINRALRNPKNLVSFKKIAHSADDILQLIQSTGGATWNFSQGNMAGTKNYAISLYPERSVILDHEPTSEEIHSYTEANSDLLSESENSFGAWFDNSSGKYYLDVVVTIPDLDEAMELGRRHNQKAIFDLEKFEEIPTGGTGEVVSKQAASDVEYWINPQGEVFDAPEGHERWILMNLGSADLPQSNFGVEGDIEETDVDELREIRREMFQQGWVRIGTPRSVGVIQLFVELESLSNIPSFVDDFLAQHFDPNNKKIIVVADQHDRSVDITDPFPTLQRAISKALRRQPRRAASLSIGSAWSHDDRAAWIAPDGKVFPVDYSHVDWYLVNKKMLQDKYNFSLTDQEEQSDDPVDWMIQNGWIRLAFATRNSKEVGVQLADINSLPSWFEDTIWQFNPKILYLEDHNGNDVKLTEDQLHRGIEKSLSRYRKAASLSKTASFEGAAWVDPKGKIYRVPESHATWISQNEDFLASKYGYTEFKDDTLVGVPELLVYGWVRVAVWSDGEGYIQVADLNSVPPSLQSFIDENYDWQNGHPIIIDDLSDVHVEVDVTGNIQEDIQNSLRLTKRRRAASLLTAKSIEDVNGIPVLVNPTPTEVRGFWNKSREKQLRALIDPATGDVFVWDAYLAEHNLIIRYFDLNIDWEEDDGTYIRHVGHDADIPQLFDAQSDVKKSTNSKAATPKHNTTWDDPLQDGEPFKPLPTTFEQSTNDENLNSRFPWRFMRRPHGPNYSNEPEVNRMLMDMPLSKRHAKLQKLAISDFAAWIDPKGKVYSVRSGGQGGTHRGWIESNADILRQEYGFEISKSFLSERQTIDIFNELLKAGWIRVGDSMKYNQNISIQVPNLRSIPSYVDDYLASFYEDGMKVEVEEGGDYQNVGQAVALDNPFPTLQKAVNRALVSKLPLASKLKTKAFSVFGFWVAPDGKAYDVRKSGSHTHGDWVMKNAALLAKYGIADAKKRDYFEVAAEMLNQGWARIGDTSRARGMVGVEVANLKNLPSYIDDTLATFMTDGQPLIVADLNDNWAEVVYPFKSLQSAVRRAVRGMAGLGLIKIAVKQQDVVDFYLMSLLPADELSGKNVDPEHYNAVAVFQAIVNDLRDEYIKRGMFELKDEAETTQWVKAIPEGEMPEELKPYYTAHESGYAGNFSGDPDEDEDEDQYDYSCEKCGEGLYSDDAFVLQDSTYCEYCFDTTLQETLADEALYCTDHHTFIVPKQILDDAPGVDNAEPMEDGTHEGHNLVNYKQGVEIDKDFQENQKKQLELPLGASKKWNLKKLAGEGYNQYAGDPWWEAPDDFSDYTAKDFYIIFKYAPWKRQYGGPLWAEVARTVHEMQQTTDLNRLIVLIDHFHDLGHNTGKLLDKFPEWHQWFKKLLDMKAQKNSLNYLLQRASSPVRKLVMDYIRVHKRHWRDEEAPEMAAHFVSREITKTAYGAAKNVLIICSGNTCRSPMAENLLRSIRPDLNVVSRGLYVPTGGGKMSPMVEQVLKEKNIPYGQHSATQVTQADIDQADIIFAMEEWQGDELLDLFPSAQNKTFLIDDLDVLDPIGGDVKEYQNVRDQLEQALRRLSSQNRQASLDKVASTHGWLAPDGTLYEFYDMNHAGWIANNRKMLKKKHGIDVGSGGFYPAVNSLVEHNWVRITGDLNDGFYVKDIRNIPESLVDFFETHTPDVFLDFIVEDINNESVRLNVEEALEKGLREAINDELKRPSIPMAASTYSDKEMAEIITEHYKEDLPDDTGPGNSYHDFPNNTTDYPKPRDTGKSPFTLDRLDNTDVPLPSYEVSWFISTPRGDDTH